MYLAASPPLFSPLMAGPLDVTGRSSSVTGFRRPPLGAATVTSRIVRSASSPFDFDFKAMTPLSHHTAALMKKKLSTFPLAGSATATSLAPPPGHVTSPPSVHHPPPPPLRSCLVVRESPPLSPSGSSSSFDSDGEGGGEEEELETSSTNQVKANPPKAKKRVVFADTAGLSLTHVKTMTEPSDCPPRWTAEFLEQVTGGASAEVAADRWELTFAQPASDYLEFRARLDSHNVSLENCLIQDGDQQLMGTVKVKNVSFAKQVTVRVTFDNWRSHKDVAAIFSPPAGLQGAAANTNTATLSAINLFDTFSFRIAIPATVASNRIQFCVRYVNDAGEFWDNNGGQNYVVVKPVELIATSQRNLQQQQTQQQQTATKKKMAAAGGIQATDLLSSGGGNRIDYWTDFASWNHLVNDSPYW